MRSITLALFMLPTALQAKEDAVATPPPAHQAPHDDQAQARDHFARALAARGLRVPPKRITPDEAMQALMIDGLFPFVAELSPSPGAHPGGRRVHGFAAADGRVVLGGDHAAKGHLLRACHLLDPSRSLGAPDIAARLVWLDQQGELVLHPPGDDPSALMGIGAGGFSWPAIKREADGGATLTYAYQPPSLRRHVPPPKLVAVRIGPDYQPRD